VKHPVYYILLGDNTMLCGLFADLSGHVVDQSSADIFSSESGSGEFWSLKQKLPSFVTIQVPGQRDEASNLKR
jgi:hypothetical protein